MKSRIGVYICRCGSNISDYVDVERVREEVEKIEGVALAKVTMFACADSTQQEMVSDIKEQDLDGMVVASCSPKLHLFTFRDVAERGGLNRYEYVQSNIREQGSWAHSDTPEEATAKAIRSVRAAIARTRLAEALTPPVISARNAAVVIGAGIAGMRAAIDLADTGSKVVLVEREHFAGGRIAQWGEIYPSGEEGAEVIRRLYAGIAGREDIDLLTGCEVTASSGSVGSFDIELKIAPRGIAEGAAPSLEDIRSAIEACPVEVPSGYDFGIRKRKAIYMPEGALPALPAIDWENCTRCGECAKIIPGIDLDQQEQTRKVETGAVVVATGFDPYEPDEGEYGFGMENVITLPQFRRLMEISDDRLVLGGREIRDIAYIYCVGSRQTGALEGDNKYCSRYCCTAAVYASVLAGRKYGGIRNYHLTRGVRTYGSQELIYDESCRRGDIYFQFGEDSPPAVSSEDGRLLVTVSDMLTENREIEIEADLVVLVTGMEPRRERSVGNILKIPAGRDGFYNEVHPKLRPVETVIDGFYLAGTCQGPKNAAETVKASHSAAVKAHALVGGGRIELEPTLARVDWSICEWCGACAEACPFDAYERIEYEGREVASVIDSACKGCGMCLPVCPVNAIQLTGFSDDEIETMIDAMAE